MDNQKVNIELLKTQWGHLLRQLENQFGQPPDLQGIIFLIGVQELGKGARKFSKDEKQDLMHVATCRVLSYKGYYKKTGHDIEGWPQWEKVQDIPQMSLRDQDIMLKECVVKYFEEEAAFKF